jgi:hypothetical protein
MPQSRRIQTSGAGLRSAVCIRASKGQDARSERDLPPLNEATLGARILGGRNQGRARNATREAGAGGASYSEAPRS